MDCQHCQNLVNDLLIGEPAPAERAEWLAHLKECPQCAREYALAQEALAAVTPTARVQATPGFEERVMSAITKAQEAAGFRTGAEPARRLRIHWRRMGPALAMAAALVLVLTPFFWFGTGARGITAAALFAQAVRAEEAQFAGKQVVHLASQIVVPPVADPELAKVRWLPLMTLEADGKPGYHQLGLAAEPGQGYTVEDQAWYEPGAGRFVRVMTVEGKPFYAAAYDGTNLYKLERAAGRAARVVQQAIGPSFAPPESPAEFLGVAAGLRSGLAEQDIKDVATIKLEDGAEARVVEVKQTPPPGGPKDKPGQEMGAYQFTIRTADSTIERMEWRVGGQALLVVRRGKAEPGAAPPAGWDLSGLAKQLQDTAPAPATGPGIAPDMVIPNVSVAHMVKAAGYPTYLFSQDPAWTQERQIADVLDVASPPHRMFVITHKARTGRHVVLVQAWTFNQALGEKIKAGKLVYTSPGGVKVWSNGDRDKWLAGILLKSAQPMLGEAPGEDITGYALETRAGTYPCLAVNGKLTEAELHGLVDSLEQAKDEAATQPE